MARKSNATAVTLGVDPGKNTFHLIGLDARGEVVLREKVARDRLVSRLANVPPCLIGIEAGMGTHYVTRELLAVGHDVRQVPPAYAKPFRQTHKSDFRDAHAIAEAVQRPTTRCVPAKTDEQLDLQAIASRPLPLGWPADRDHQSDPQLSLGAWHHRAPAAPLAASCIAGHSCPTHGCAVTADDPDPCGSGSGLASSR
jgi:hypothetical protein